MMQGYVGYLGEAERGPSLFLGYRQSFKLNNSTI
jgi:hypothetical protein